MSPGNNIAYHLLFEAINNTIKRFHKNLAIVIPVDLNSKPTIQFSNQ